MEKLCSREMDLYFVFLWQLFLFALVPFFLCVFHLNLIKGGHLLKSHVSECQFMWEDQSELQGTDLCPFTGAMKATPSLFQSRWLKSEHLNPSIAHRPLLSHPYPLFPLPTTTFIFSPSFAVTPSSISHRASSSFMSCHLSPLQRSLFSSFMSTSYSFKSILCSSLRELLFHVTNY